MCAYTRLALCSRFLSIYSALLLIFFPPRRFVQCTHLRVYTYRYIERFGFFSLYCERAGIWLGFFRANPLYISRDFRNTRARKIPALQRDRSIYDKLRRSYDSETLAVPCENAFVFGRRIFIRLI